jgi:uncharacterized membrane protein YeiB
MALSNYYLLQSVLMNVVLLWFRLRLWGELTRLQGMGLVCALQPAGALQRLWSRRCLRTRWVALALEHLWTASQLLR